MFVWRQGGFAILVLFKMSIQKKELVDVSGGWLPSLPMLLFSRRIHALVGIQVRKPNCLLVCLQVCPHSVPLPLLSVLLRHSPLGGYLVQAGFLRPVPTRPISCWPTPIVGRFYCRVGRFYHRFCNSRPTVPIKHV